ncbi:MAG TPA: hypothetical protein PLK34_01995 [Candidatus Pacearchaeota archaeon]|nr:hypothetical protein [Candidatus Pacearchaeota archaeon]
MAMKKEGIIAIVLLTIVFSSLFISADMFDDIWSRITGNAIKGNYSAGKIPPSDDRVYSFSQNETTPKNQSYNYSYNYTYNYSYSNPSNYSSNNKTVLRWIKKFFGFTGKVTDMPPKGMIPAPNDPVKIVLGCTVDVSECGGDYPEEVMIGSIYVNITDNTEYCLLSAYDLDEDYVSWPFEGTCAEVKENSDGFCYDSDFGKYPDIFGKVQWETEYNKYEGREDECRGSNKLMEYYCVPYDTDQCGEINGCRRYKFIDCSSECKDGKCTSGIVDETKTCEEMEGEVCEEGYECSEDFDESSDEDECCTAGCEEIVTNDETCEEMEGTVCEEDEECSEKTKLDSEDVECCLGECGEKKPTNNNAGTCPQISYRKNGNYCGEDLKYHSQLGEAESCENNFECQSNLCISGECVSSTFMEKILTWFKKLFGVDTGKKGDSGNSNTNENNNNNGDELGTCEELEGTVCEEGDKCSEDVVKSSDEDECCTAGCEEIVTNDETCEEMEGTVCEEDEECSEKTKLDSEGAECCTAKCEEKISNENSDISGKLTCSQISSNSIKLTYEYESENPNVEVTLFRGGKKVTLLPPRLTEQKKDEENIFYVYNVPNSISSKYLNTATGPFCPEGWTNYKSWLASTSEKYPKVTFCKQCETDTQTFGNHEKDSCTREGTGWCQTVTGYSKVTQLGCVPSGKGSYIDGGLTSSTEYIYYLKEGGSENSLSLIAEVTCKTTKEVEEGIEEPDLTPQETETYTCEDCEEYYETSCEYKYQNDFAGQGEKIQACKNKGYATCASWKYCCGDGKCDSSENCECADCAYTDSCR